MWLTRVSLPRTDLSHSFQVCVDVLNGYTVLAIPATKAVGWVRTWERRHLRSVDLRGRARRNRRLPSDLFGIFFQEKSTLEVADQIGKLLKERLQISAILVSFKQ